MISIDDSYVDSAAPNAAAAKNGRALLLKKKFSATYLSAEKDLLFGECQGSGKSPYQCSCDFAQPDSPVHRCSCPSRQFPCKHCLGLMYAYTQNPAQFKVADVPEDLQQKREKASVRKEKKKEEAAKPRKVNKTALAKKLKSQLEGIDLLQQLTEDLVSIGIGNMNAKSAQEIEKRAKQLGDSYLPGAQMALRGYTRLFHRDGYYDDEMTTAQKEAIYGQAVDQLARLRGIIKQGRQYLQSRLDDPDLKPETDSSIAAWLGHAWQLQELREAGLVASQVPLMQLAFNCHDDTARQEWVDCGIWINLQDGRIYNTYNYRPYRAAKFIKAEDSFFQVAQITELFFYPGDVNPRVRWEAMTTRPATDSDFQSIWKAAEPSFQNAVKTVKTNLKGPLSDRQPVMLLKFHSIGKVGDQTVVEDAKGERLVLTDIGLPEEPSSLPILPLVPSNLLKNQVLVARFRHDLDRRQLEVKPLAIVTQQEVVRLTL